MTQSSAQQARSAQARVDAAENYNALLLLEDGTVFYGRGIGQPGMIMGEMCFNTSMTGYQEVLTDPSYAGQIINFTFPHIGDVGVNDEDVEAAAPLARGLVLRDMVEAHSNWRAQGGLAEWLEAHRLTGIVGVDTRQLTNIIRTKGALNALIYYQDNLSGADLGKLKTLLKQHPSLAGAELARDAGTPEPYEWTQGEWDIVDGYAELKAPKRHAVVVDYGTKYNILRQLSSRGCKVTVVPADYPADRILALKPDGVLLSNGPGDPAATARYAGPIIRALVDAGLPIFGICMGHQLLSLALGGKTAKMHQGHRGANHPIKHVETGVVEITCQNHGFVVNPGSLPENVVMSHFSLFDHTLAGIRIKDKPVFSVQYHPEASPGPRDSRYLFDRFVEAMDGHAEKR